MARTKEDKLIDLTYYDDVFPYCTIARMSKDRIVFMEPGKFFEINGAENLLKLRDAINEGLEGEDK